MNTSRQEIPISEQAARWMDVAKSQGTEAQRAFAAWLRESPHHVREYLLITALEKDLGEIDLQGLDVEQILADARRNVVPLSSAVVRAPEPRREVRLRRWAAAAVAFAVLALAAWKLADVMDGTETYATEVGEQRLLELADGSVVQLSPLSRMSVRISAEARDVRLLEGEARFKVEHDSARPFLVHSGDMLIRDIGTQFHVHRRASSTVVSVTEGAVEISRPAAAGVNSALIPTLVKAGQEARIAAVGGTIERKAFDVAQATAWSQHHLTFSGDTLVDIAEDFNRYNHSPQIRIEGDALRAKRYSGGFEADDPESLVEYLRQDGSIRVERRNDDLIIRSAR